MFLDNYQILPKSNLEVFFCIRRGKRRPIRWYRAPETESKEIMGIDLYAGFDAKMPSEWESWLRHRRDEPPTEDQIRRSLALSELKKMNAAKLEMERIEELKTDGRYDGPEVKPMDHEKAFYPKYDDYEVNPGDLETKKDRWASYKNPYLPDDHQHTRKK